MKFELPPWLINNKTGNILKVMKHSIPNKTLFPNVTERNKHGKIAAIKCGEDW